MTIGFEASAMPFGKRGLVRDEEPLGQADPFIPPPPPPSDPTARESLTYFWKVCKALPMGIGQGFVSLGYHVFSSAVLAIGILFVSPAVLSRFADAMTPFWPLLARAHPYMDAHGHHDLFLYMSAMYAKDTLLIAVFSLRNIFWAFVVLVKMRSKIKLQLHPRTSLCLIVPLFLYVALDQIYYGPVDIPDHSYLGNTIFDGGILRGIVFPALLFDPLAVWFLFGVFLIPFFPANSTDRGALGQLKQMRRM